MSIKITTKSNGTSYTAEYPCEEFNGLTTMFITLTIQMSKDGHSMKWDKRCARCGKMKNVLDFIKNYEIKKVDYPHTLPGFDYCVLNDGPHCSSCDPPKLLRIFVPSHTISADSPRGKLLTRLNLHYANGEEYLAWDEKIPGYVPIVHFGIRRMKKDNRLNFQPYGERGQDKMGRSYPKNKVKTNDKADYEQQELL